MTGMAETGKARQLQTVRKALRLLQHLAKPPGVWSITQLSQELRFPKSVVHSLLATLQSEGFVQKEVDSRYRLGLQLLFLGDAVQAGSSIRNLALPVLQVLAQAAQESAYLMVQSGARGVLLERADPPNPIRITMAVGQSGYLHAGSSPKAILAWMEPEEIDAYIEAEGLPATTPSTPTEPVVLKRQLAECRAQGYAYTEEESFEGIAGIAAPVFDRGGRVIASVGIAGILQRVSARREELATRVIASAGELSRSVGFVGKAETWQRR